MISNPKSFFYVLFQYVQIAIYYFVSSMKKFREETISGDQKSKEQQFKEGPQSAYGYGGKFGVQKDRFGSC